MDTEMTSEPTSTETSKSEGRLKRDVLQKVLSKRKKATKTKKISLLQDGKGGSAAVEQGNEDKAIYNVLDYNKKIRSAQGTGQGIVGGVYSGSYYMGNKAR